ncbi:MAG: PQQ-binding-like beta-propeller repeat protein [Parvibaculales bacterium]
MINGKKFLHASLVMMLTVGVSSCGWFGDDGEDNGIKKKVKGERISVLSFERRLEADPRLAGEKVVLPRPYANLGWTQPGGFADNVAHHLELGDNLKKLFSVSMVEGSSRDIKLTAPPLVAGDRVFALGADLEIVALDAQTGKRLWRTDLSPRKSEIEDGFGGGIAFADGQLFAVTGFGEVMAIDALTGTVSWRVQTPIPFRTAPTVSDGRIFAVSHDNQLQVFSTDDGARVWNQTAILEPATILSATSPAVAGDLVVAGFTSGEVLAMRTNNGLVNWSDSLTRARQLTPLSDLAAVIGRPVIDRDRVFAVSHGGRMVSIDLRSGERVWMSEITSIETPWIAGDNIFVVTIDAEVVCLSRNQGRVRWVKQLEKYEDGDFDEPISWSGPVLASDRLILGNSLGEVVTLSPYTGEIISTIDVGDPVEVTPVVANKTLYILTDDGRLIAYQ